MQYIFRVELPYHALLPYYRGQASIIETRDNTGRMLHIHCRHLMPFFSSAGIYGTFKMVLDDQGELVSLDLI